MRQTADGDPREPQNRRVEIVIQVVVSKSIGWQERRLPARFSYSCLDIPVLAPHGQSTRAGESDAYSFFAKASSNRLW